MFLFGINLPKKRKIDISLRYCYGFGEISQKKFIAKIGYNLKNKLSLSQRFIIKSQELVIPLIVKSKVKKRVGVFFKQNMLRNNMKLKYGKSLKALRHSFFLPVRGQRTRKNAQTQKSKRLNRRKIPIPKKRK